jgi:hypothetical protein
MGTRVWGVVAALAVATAGCGDVATGPQGTSDAALLETDVQGVGEIELALGRTAEVPVLGLRISFDAVAEDSRCPTNALILCVWEGNAAVDLGIALHGEAPFVARLNTTLEPSAFERGPVRVVLLQVLPVPYDVGPIPAESYSVKILVQPAN